MGDIGFDVQIDPDMPDDEIEMRSAGKRYRFKFGTGKDSPSWAYQDWSFEASKNSWRGEEGQPGSCFYCGEHRSLHREGAITTATCPQGQTVTEKISD